MKRTYIVNISHKGDIENFPIFKVIAKHRNENDEDRIVVIRPDGQGNQRNNEILSRLSEMGIQSRQIRMVEIGKKWNQSSLLELIGEIMEEISDQSQIYADMTNASSAVSLIMMYVVNIVEKIRGCEVEGIFCRDIIGEGVCDLMVLKLLGDIAEQMKALGIYKMKEVIERIFIQRDSSRQTEKVIEKSDRKMQLPGKVRSI